MIKLIFAGYADQTELLSDVLTEQSASLVNNSVRVAMDGIHAVIAVVVDVTGNLSSVQTSDVNVFYRVTSSADWASAGVYQVRAHYITSHKSRSCLNWGTIAPSPPPTNLVGTEVSFRLPPRIG